eukprot:scaffold2260_cov134-Isochrysis_galbana.AAC.8
MLCAVCVCVWCGGVLSLDAVPLGLVTATPPTPLLSRGGVGRARASQGRGSISLSNRSRSGRRSRAAATVRGAARLQVHAAAGGRGDEQPRAKMGRYRTSARSSGLALDGCDLAVPLDRSSGGKNKTPAGMSWREIWRARGRMALRPHVIQRLSLVAVPYL